MTTGSTWVITPDDDYMHRLGLEPDFNESAYFNAFDTDNGLGAFFRLGNRANEGHAEMTACIYHDGHELAFMFGRPPIADNSAFDAGGLRFEVLEPFRELCVTYHGEVVLLDDARQLADPKKAFASNSHVPCNVELSYHALCGVWHPGGPAPGASLGHYEQPLAVTGSIEFAHHRWEVSGFGVRDHSWGPRTWQRTAPWGSWVTAPLADDMVAMGLHIDDGSGVALTDGGFVWDGVQLHECDHCRVTEVQWSAEEAYPRHVSAELTAGDRSWALEGRVLSVAPLRHRRAGDVTRICEALMEWTIDGDRTGLGLAELTDQIVDGKPARLA